MSTVEKQQDGFKSQWGFIMACIGSAVGMATMISMEKLSARREGSDSPMLRGSQYSRSPSQSAGSCR